jgi:hypothetical protein
MKGDKVTTGKWTIVQHSAFGYKQDPQFERAVETRQIANSAEMIRVNRAHGCVFNSYLEAEEFAEKANYPDDNKSIIPSVKGKFSVWKIDGLCLYIPVREAPVG